MLDPQDSLIARQLKERIVKITPVERMIVFGSRARGDATGESDMDLFIELPVLNPGLRRQILEITWEISLESGIVISVLLTSSAQLSAGRFAGNPILRAIQSEGVVI